MAKIVLHVDLDPSEALKKIGTLKSDLSNIGTAVGTGTGTSGGRGVSGAVKEIDNLQKGYANLSNTIRNTKSQFTTGLFDDLGKSTSRALTGVKGLNAAIIQWTTD